MPFETFLDSENLIHRLPIMPTDEADILYIGVIFLLVVSHLSKLIDDDPCDDRHHYDNAEEVVSIVKGEAEHIRPLFGILQEPADATIRLKRVVKVRYQAVEGGVAEAIVVLVEKGVAHQHEHVVHDVEEEVGQGQRLYRLDHGLKHALQCWVLDDDVQ